MSKLSKESKQIICKTLGISIDENDDKVIYDYIEHIDNEPIGHTDYIFARSNASCCFESSVNKSLDDIAKYCKTKKSKQKMPKKQDILVR